MGTLRTRPLPPENGAEAWTAIHAWITKKPGLNPEDYFGGMPWSEARRMYETEKKQITRARAKALDLWKQASSKTYSQEQLAAACRNAYNGRTYWTYDGEIDYCPGQYGAAEYRNAAIAVLESYLYYVKDLPQYHDGTDWQYGTDPRLALDTAE